MDASKSALFVCDVQQKLLPVMRNSEAILTNVERLVKAAKVLKMPIIATEQYPTVLFTL